ncbi:MAG: PQQ-binding-like beta-propeller repeat protein [Planctomycetes bacterium]|nr:PQQ-binding-like beta-propeller repeat protein [Planctomycetota bacterium]
MFINVQRTRGPLTLLAALALLLPSQAASADGAGDWPGFRGINVDGVSAETHVFEHADGFSLRIAWKRPLGKGYSGVSIVDGRAVTMFSDGVNDFAIALDPGDGRELWRYTIDKTYKGRDGSHDGPISTPLIADGRVFGLHPSGKLFALDAKTGKELWAADLVSEHGAVKPHYGFATSPLLVDGVLIVQGGAKDAAVSGFDPASGKRLWNAGTDKVSYQAPILINLNGKRQVVAAGDKNLLAIDAANGVVLWEHAHGGAGERGAAVLVPVAVGDGRLFLSHKEDRATLLELSRDGASGVSVKPLWEERCIRNTYTVPVYQDGFIYGCNNRIFTCVDARTGKPAWRSRAPGDGFPIVVDGHIVVATKKGSVHVIKADSSGYHEVASLQALDDLVWTPPSFAQGSIFVRGMKEIARIDIRGGARPGIARAESGIDISGSRFAGFLEELSAAADKKAVVDRFMAANTSFPIVEPDGLMHFIYRGPGEDLAVAGDLAGVGDDQPMRRAAGTDLFYLSARLESNARLSYAFMRDFEKITDPLNPRTTTISFFNEDMEMAMGNIKTEVSWLAMPGWKRPTFLDEPDASRRGRVESQKLTSKTLGAEVSIDVYLPHGYEDGNARYPVAYVHMGMMAREGGQYETALDNLIGERVAPLIVVFINHPPPFFAFDKYAAMVADELVPFVDQKYRTVRTAEGRANVSSGFSGLGAIFCTFGHPSTFGKLALQTPFMVDFVAVDRVLKKAGDHPLRIYLDWGKYDLRSPLESWSMVKAGRELDQRLRKLGYKPLGGEAPDGTDWPSWRNRTDALFEALFPIRK